MYSSLGENSLVPRILVLFVGPLCALLSSDLKEKQNLESPSGRAREGDKRVLALEEGRLKDKSEHLCEGTEAELHAVVCIEEN